LKLRTAVLFLTVPLALGGCGVVQQVELAKAKERLATQRADCRTRFSESHGQAADCLTAAEDETIRPFTGNDSDLLTLMQAKRKVLAVKVDRGEMANDAALLELAQFASALHDESLQRMNATRAASAQQSAASAQMLGAAAMMLQASKPAPIITPTPSPMVTTTCMPMGSTVNCTSR
jgi:hypothetical protein